MFGESIEAEIRAHRLPLGEDVVWRDEVIWPHYGGLSIANFPASAAAALGVEMSGTAPPLDARVWPEAMHARRMVVILLDGFGYELLRELCAEEPGCAEVLEDIVGDGSISPLTSVFPSTTVAALATLWTGAAPAAHGLLGTRLLLRERGILADMLRLSPVDIAAPAGFDLETFLPMPCLAERFAAAGVDVHLVMLSHLPGSGLSRILHRGVDKAHIHRALAFEDMWGALDEALEATRGRRAYIFAYWSALDSISHHTGARSRRALAEARLQMRRLRDVVAGLEAGTVLVVLADHGHVDTPVVIEMKDHGELSDMFRMPFAAEPRARLLFLRAGMKAHALAYLRRTLSDYVMPLDAQEALAAGFFGTGKIYAETRARVGDVIAVGRRGLAMHDALDHFRLKSHHGALAAAEMLVPCIVRRI